MMERLNSFFEQVRQAPMLMQQQALAYRQFMTEHPEECQRRALIGTVALGVMALAATLFSARVRPLSCAVLTPMITIYSQASWMIFSFNRTPESKTDEAIAKDTKRAIRYSLIALTVIGTGATAALLKKLSGFAALFALLTLGTAAAHLHIEKAFTEITE